ncbi:MAG: YfaZ family protein, partial [Thiovulaceae bacterium]|nr:YfaZ family protein [Sulfurimonadaceae bacterium]
LNFPIPIGLSASAYYAPKSLSFSDAGGYLEYRTEVYANLMERASVYVGYRKINTKYDFSNNIYDITYNKSIYYGIKFSF